MLLEFLIMKFSIFLKSFLFFSLFLIIDYQAVAQAPESMNYQAVIRDGSGNILANQSVGIRIDILQGSASGTSVYQETFTTTTNAYGSIAIQIGTGTVVSGTFSTIDWGANSYFVETAVDISGGTNYSVISTTQFVSVPYALYAKNARLDSAAVQGMIDASGSGYGSSGNPGGSLLNSVNVPMVESYNLNTTNYNYGDIVFDISNDELKILKMHGSATNSFFTGYPNPCNDGGSNRANETYYVSFQVLDTIVINSIERARYLTTNWYGGTYYCTGNIEAVTISLYANPDTTILIDNVSNLGTLIQNSSPLFPGRIYTIQIAPSSASNNYGNVTVTNNSLYTVNASFFKNINYGKLSSSSIVNTTYFPYIKSGREYFFKFSEPQKTWLTIGP